jgi:hypothetical protein
MSIDKYLTIDVVDGQKLVTPTVTSTGISSGGKILALNPQGSVDESNFPYLFTGTIAASTTATICTIPFVGFTSSDLVINFSGNDLNKSFTMSIVKNGLSVDDTIFRRVGQMNLSVSAQVSGSDILVTTTNSEAFAISYRVRRIVT